MDELLDTVTTVESPHDTFRVWITTEPHNLFSITLLQVTLHLQFNVLISQFFFSLMKLKITFKNENDSCFCLFSSSVLHQIHK